eukprot:5591238-Prymnesium_polylepis.1
MQKSTLGCATSLVPPRIASSSHAAYHSSFTSQHQYGRLPHGRGVAARARRRAAALAAECAPCACARLPQRPRRHSRRR